MKLDALAMFRAMLDAVPHSICVKDIHGRYLMGNSAFFERMPDGEIIGRLDSDVLPARVIAQVKEQDRLVCATGSAAQFHIKFQRDGREIMIRNLRSPLRDADGEIEGIICYSQDVTDHERLRRKMTQMRKLDGLGRNAGNIAHDFNNMLSTILGFAELAEFQLTGQPDDGLKDCIESITAAAERGKALVGDTLALGNPVQRRKRPADPPAEVSLLSGHKVLVAEDDRALASHLYQALAANGLKVTVEHDGERALGRFSATPDDYDVLITDLMMPGLDGLELVGQAREVRATLPVVLLTGYADSIDDEQADAMGIDRLLRKPANADALVNAVAALL